MASPSSAADISQTTADVVFQGDSLGPVADIVAVARRARAIMRENIEKLQRRYPEGFSVEASINRKD